MSCTVYALLVGIDKYQPPVPPLNGCVTDITAFEALIRERISAANFQLDILTLKNEEATRQSIIDGFLNHLSKAGSEDVALFYYSGHGSQERTPLEFRYLEPDGLDETLVCYDSRTQGNYDLADKELSKLIATIAKRDPHILVILDSCHSGSGTRQIEAGGVRRVPTDFRERPIDTFLITPDEAKTLDVRNIETETDTGWLTLPQGKHIVISACRDDEEAKETYQGGQTRGIFSYSLMEVLEAISSQVTYRDLFKRVNALVRTRAARQSPLIEATDLRDLDRPFLGGAIESHPSYYTVSFDAQDGWIIDGGAIHGIAPVSGNETTILALFPVDADMEKVKDLKASIGEARVIARMPARSKVELNLNDNQQPDTKLTYKAIIVATPLAPLEVEFRGDQQALDLVRSNLAKAGPDQTPSLLVRDVDHTAEMTLLAEENRYRIQRSADDRSLVVDIDGFTEDGAQKAVQRLEHIARWKRVAELANQPRSILPDEVRMEIFLVERDEATGREWLKPVDIAEQGSELRLSYEQKNGQWTNPRFKIKLTNTGIRPLYSALLDLPETYSIWSGLLPGGGIWLKPVEEAWALSGQAISASVPDELWNQGVIEIKDLLKLIVSTDEFDATLLDQEDLDVKPKSAGTRAAVRGVSTKSALERLMRRVATRHFGAEPSSQENVPDWVTAEVSITTVRPRAAVSIPAAQRSASLLPNVEIKGHPGLKANARLTTIPVASRALNKPALPALLRDDPLAAQPFLFSSSRSGEPGLGVLELTEIDSETVATVAPDQPLVLRAEARLDEDEHVLPVGYDGEFYLPLGYARRVGNAVEINIERLPAPLSDSRSLTGSIKIMFQKIAGKRLGAKYEYPLLAAVERKENGDVNYINDPGEVKARVAAADRILLYVHGIIGDTFGMASSAWTQFLKLPTTPPALADRYNLILAFDYENINTPIEETARLLKERLEDAGLRAGHNKTLHIAAHSMGGLVSRWFIEREGGNQIVQHLVMLGTPNAGSPWPTVQAWATTALGVALNGLSTVAWPVKALAGLLSALEVVDNTLDQMQPGSEFLKTLYASPAPGTAYTILAGNTSLIAAASAGGDKGLLSRLLAKLHPQNLLHSTTALAFFGNPNDIAVSVDSILSVPTGRAPAPVIEQVASDHISYFSTEAGLNALAEALK